MKRKVSKIFSASFYFNCISFLLIVLFTYTAVTKLTEADIFRISLILSPFTRPFAGLLVWFVPLTELLIVVLLFIPRWGHIGMLASATLLLLFAVYILIMLLFVPDLPCSCGGIISQLNWREHLLVNATLSVLAFIAYKGSLKTKYTGEAENLLTE